MAESDGTVFGRKATEQIAKTVREVARRVMNEQPHRARWQNVGGARIQIRDALVIECYGDGFYLVELADMGPMTVPVDGECDPCNGGSCDEPNEQITRTLPIGTGDYVTAYDSRKLPQEIGGHCQIAWTGWREANTASGATEKIYSVIVPARAVKPLNIEDWDCCDNVVTRIECKTIYFEYHECEPELTPCPSV